MKNDKNLFSYHYREIICGCCHHRFVFIKETGEQGHKMYYMKKNGTFGVTTKCPDCGEMLVAFDDETEAVPFVLRDDRDEIEVGGFIAL